MADAKTYTVTHPTKDLRTVTALEFRAQFLAREGYVAPPELLEELKESDRPGGTVTIP